MRKFIIYVAGGVLFSLACPSFAQAKINAYIQVNPFSWFYYPTYKVVKVRQPVRKRVKPYKIRHAKFHSKNRYKPNRHKKKCSKNRYKSTHKKNKQRFIVYR